AALVFCFSDNTVTLKRVKRESGPLGFCNFKSIRKLKSRHSRAGVHPGLSGFGFSDRFSLRWGF
uniref:hypothetical protein n=1 Tax=Neisseria gonorrhoeae TaxID=485 RepID=UPI0028051B0D